MQPGCILQISGNIWYSKSMSFSVWHSRVVKKITPPSELQLYVRVFIFGFLIAAAYYWYTTWLKIPNPLNKTFADTSITLIGLSMLLSSVCYFWDFMDTKIIYRKHLGLVGFAFGLAHIFLSFGVFTRLFTSQAWQQGIPYGPITGVLATIIFAIMAIVSNQYAAHVLGGVSWRKILRTGYLAVALVWLHVFFLKWVYVSRWIQGGMKTPPSSSAIVLLLMIVVIVMRGALWFSLLKKRR